MTLATTLTNYNEYQMYDTWTLLKFNSCSSFNHFIPIKCMFALHGQCYSFDIKVLYYVYGLIFVESNIL